MKNTFKPQSLYKFNDDEQAILISVIEQLINQNQTWKKYHTTFYRKENKLFIKCTYASCTEWVDITNLYQICLRDNKLSLLGI